MTYYTTVTSYRFLREFNLCEWKKSHWTHLVSGSRNNLSSVFGIQIGHLKLCLCVCVCVCARACVLSVWQPPFVCLFASVPRRHKDERYARSAPTKWEHKWDDLWIVSVFPSAFFCKSSVKKKKLKTRKKKISKQKPAAWIQCSTFQQAA